MPVFEQRVLILCKTYPSPSEKYSETSCVAGVLPDGSLIRLYPVPFRLIKTDQQFKKWQWINAHIEKSKRDHRPESFQIKTDTVKCDPEPISTKNHWFLRREALSKTPILSSYSQLLDANRQNKQSLALLRPSDIVDLEIEPVATPDWTEKEIAKLVQQQQQSQLFEEDEKEQIRTLRKLPFSFYYRYQSRDSDGIVQDHRHKIVDWEAGALFWRARRDYGDGWKEKFRLKMLDDMRKRDMVFLMGNQHRFQDQWLIVSILYLPRIPESNQGSLFW